MTNDAAPHPPYAPVVTHADNDKWIETLPGEKLRVHVRSSLVNGAYAVLESEALPGVGGPLHYHKEDEVFFILQGTMTFSLAGEIVEAGVGSTVLVPAFTHHTWQNRTNAPVRMLAVFTPGGIEPMFEGMAGLTPEQLVPFAASFGTIVVGPPMS